MPLHQLLYAAASRMTFPWEKKLTRLVSDAEVSASLSEQLDAVDKALFAGHVQRRVFLLLVFRLHICTRPVVRCMVSAQRATTGRPLRVQGLRHTPAFAASNSATAPELPFWQAKCRHETLSAAMADTSPPAAASRLITGPWPAQEWALLPSAARWTRVCSGLKPRQPRAGRACAAGCTLLAAAASLPVGPVAQ